MNVVVETSERPSLQASERNAPTLPRSDVPAPPRSAAPTPPRSHAPNDTHEAARVMRRIHARNGKRDWSRDLAERKLLPGEPRATETSAFGGLTMMSENMVADVLGCAPQNVHQAERSALWKLRHSEAAVAARDFLRHGRWGGKMTLWNNSPLTYRSQSAWREQLARWLTLADLLELECPEEATLIRGEVSRLTECMRSK